ncbi:Nucleic acid-binding OB-fold [Arabidopsis thaliana x Arabidopsis arenosa]|uniref:Nucleic acid-binding OB-fold n=2 Tax=Arabidopsis TaxID=3701 RepID=A0A8T2C1R4_9BRAS|nr:Nucleic acid-binding OB-fold [Arabidopsis thaliana x Arabidopsis arenosa]
MPPKKAKQSPQPFTFQIFDDIDGDFCEEEVLVRLIHFWEARNFKRGNILMGLELLLIDSQSNAVQGFISANRLFHYEEHLKRNSIYKLKKFMITPAKKIYKVSDHKHGICFTEKTSMVNVTLGDHQIDEQKFRFRNFEEFSAIVDTNIDLFDVIGQLRLITGDNLHAPTTMETAPHVEGNRSSDRVFLHLLLKDGETIRIYLWGNIAASFRERWNKSEVKPTVLLLTTVNPKTIGATVSLSSTSSTRLFFDTDVDETKQFLTWLGDNCKTTPTIASSSSAVTKLETVTINEIHQFLQNANPQEVSFTCFATILDILPQYGWYYISCSTCNNKLEKADTSMYCNTCKEYNNVGLVRYRIEIRVGDKNGDLATFVVLNSEAAKIAGKRADAVLNEYIEAEGNDACEGINTIIPECLKHIIGNTCKFQIKLTNYNFNTSRQTITISRIIDPNTAFPTDSCEENAKEGDVDYQITVTSKKTRGKSDTDNPAAPNGNKDKRPRLDN